MLQMRWKVCFILKRQRKKDLNLQLYLVIVHTNGQKSLHDTYVRRQGKAEADSVSAIPGTSEHQTGLAHGY